MKTQEINYGEPQVQKKVKKKRKNSKRIIIWIKFILVTALLVTTVVLLALSPLFNITKIEVNGSQHYKQDDIIAASGIIIGSNGFKTIGSDIKNIFTFRYGIAEKNILKRYSYVKSVVVRFIVSGKVRVNIVERKPEAVVPYTGINLLIDREAYVLEAFDKKVSKSLPLIKGLKIKQFQVGQAIKIENTEAYTDAIELINRIKVLDEKSEFKMYKLINSIDVSDRGNIKLLLDSRLTVDFGNLSDLDYRIDFCKKIVFEKLLKEDRGFIDMTAENPSFTPQK